jgi:hypothetical protein
VTAISPPERAGLANTLVPRDLSRGDGILGSSGLPKLISGHILSYHMQFRCRGATRAQAVVLEPRGSARTTYELRATAVRARVFCPTTTIESAE